MSRLIGRTKGGMNTKLHAATYTNGRPISFFITTGQVSDYTGAASLLDELPKAKWLLADRGYDADWYPALYRRSPPHHSGSETPRQVHQIRQTSLQTAQPNRDHVRPSQRLAACSDAL
ncbi:protein of unknown function [Nitratireductor aquimarinus]